MRVLVACEFSGRVREAFRKLGHEAWSCDVLPADDNSPYHIQDDVLKHLDDGWDLMIAHPPCTHLAVSGARYFPEKIADGRQQAALDFVQRLLVADIPMIALENPVSVISSKIRKPTQTIQPYQFGHPETKKTCLWLKGLPKLTPTNVVEPDFMRNHDGSFKLDKKGKKYSRIHWMTPSHPDRAKLRSLTYQGIADAMANQWSSVPALTNKDSQE